MTTINGVKRFVARTTRLGLMSAVCLMAGGALAAGFDGKTVTNAWFAADFTTGLTDVTNTPILKDSTTGITPGTGSWTAVPTTGTAKIADAGEGATLLSIEGEYEDGALTFTPVKLSSVTGMETVTVNMKTIAADTLPDPESGAQGAFAIYSEDGENHSLMAYVSDGTTGGVWTNLVYASAADLTNDWFTLTLDFATVSNVRKVRYSITQDGSLTVLEDKEGTQWFRAADDDAATVAAVSFLGTGKVRTFSGYFESPAESVVVENLSQDEANEFATNTTVTLTYAEVTQGLEPSYYKVIAVPTETPGTYTMSVVLDEEKVGVDLGEADEGVDAPVTFTGTKPTFHLQNNVKKGLYYSVGTVSDPLSSPIEFLDEQKATVDGESISLTPEPLDFDGGNVIYFKLSVSDKAQKTE